MTNIIKTNQVKCHNSKINISLINKNAKILKLLKNHYLTKIDTKSKEKYS